MKTNTNTFTTNSGMTYTISGTRYFKANPVSGKKIRIGKDEFEIAYDLFVKEENERHNAVNQFTNIMPAGEFNVEIEDAWEEAVNNGEIEEDEGLNTENMWVRHPDGTDLQNPAVINEYGCVDCSKCNVQNCVHRDCMRRNPTSEGGLAECPRLKVKVEEPKVEQPKAKKQRKPRKSKDIAYTYYTSDRKSEVLFTLTAKQVDFIKHLPDTCFWENGIESCIWVDCLCDDIGGQFAGKPMTVGAMISTLCEKGLGTRCTERRENKKCTSFELTELGQAVAIDLGLW